MTAIADLKQAHRATWAAGDYAAVAERIDEAPPRDLLARVGGAPGQEVLDVATGTGNIALRAASAGAQVVGLDLTPELFATARRRAADQRAPSTGSRVTPRSCPSRTRASTPCCRRSACSSRRATTSSPTSWCASAGPAG